MFPSHFVASVCDAIDGARRADRPILVAIDGPGCSGKSTLAQSLLLALADDAASIGIDEFFVPFCEQDLRCAPCAAVLDGVAHLRWRELLDVTDRLARGCAASYRPYDWEGDVLADVTRLTPRPIILVEGLYAMHRMLRDAYAFKVWVDGSSADRMLRVNARDGERLLGLWHTVYVPRESWYLQSQRPFDDADLFVLGAGLEWGATHRSFCHQLGSRHA